MTGAAPGSRLISVWLGGLDGRTWWALHDDEPHLAASTIKLPYAIAAQRAQEDGTLDLDAPVPVHADFASTIEGERFRLDPDDDQDPATWDRLGSEDSLRALVHRMLVSSGNLAADLVLEQVGLPAVSAVLTDAGCSERTMLVRAIGDTPARSVGLENVVTARDLARVMTGVGARTLGAPLALERVETDLAAQHYRGGIPAGLPAGLKVANKTGWIGGVNHDVALVRPPDRPPFVLVVLSRHGVSEREGEQLVARVAGRAWTVLEQRAGDAVADEVGAS